MERVNRKIYQEMLRVERHRRNSRSQLYIDQSFPLDFPRARVSASVSVRCGVVRDVHWFEVTEKLRDSHPAYTGPSDGLQSAESL